MGYRSTLMFLLVGGIALVLGSTARSACPKKCAMITNYYLRYNGTTKVYFGKTACSLDCENGDTCQDVPWIPQNYTCKESTDSVTIQVYMGGAILCPGAGDRGEGYPPTGDMISEADWFRHVCVSPS